MKECLKSFLFFILILLGSCQQKQDGKKILPKAVYDRPRVAAIYEQAATDEAVFESFKRDPVFNLMHENAGFEDGLRQVQCIEEKYPDLLNGLEAFRLNDAIGSPRVYDYGHVGVFSPTTLHYVALCGQIQESLGDLEGKQIVQIGGGYGGLCRILSGLHSFNSYTIIDFPFALKLIERYLKQSGIEGVKLVSIEDLKEDLAVDAVISDWSFSELSKPVQEVIINRVLIHAHCGFLLGRQLPKHFGIIPFSAKELSKKLAKKGLEPHVENQESLPSQNSYILLWKKSSVSVKNILQNSKH